MAQGALLTAVKLDIKNLVKLSAKLGAKWDPGHANAKAMYGRIERKIAAMRDIGEIEDVHGLGDPWKPWEATEAVYMELASKLWENRPVLRLDDPRREDE